MARVVLVRQRKPHFEVNHTHPLGLMHLAAYLRARAGHEVFILDNRIRGLPFDELVERTIALKPDVVGLSGLTIEAPAIYRFAAAIRRRAPAAFLAAGGIHATCFPENAAIEADVDAVAVGEGELTFEQAIRARSAGEPLAAVPGLALRGENGAAFRTAAREPILDLDALPMPAWDLIEPRRYFGKRMGDLMYSDPRQMSLFTSRGCPFRCIYCHNVFGKTFRAHSPQRVFDEIATCWTEYGVREFHFQDDAFNLDRERAKEICRRIIASPLRPILAFPNGVRGDLMDEELIDLLRQAGARRIAYAVESATPRIQQMIRKEIDLARLAETARQTAKRGILVKGFFMLGFPGETLEEMAATARFARDHAFDVANFSRVIPTPHSELARLAEASGRTKPLVYEQYAYDYSDVNLSAVDDRAFERAIRRAYRTFMSRPARWLRLFRVFPNKKQIFTYYLWLLAIKLLAPKRPRTNRTTRSWRVRY